MNTLMFQVAPVLYGSGTADQVGVKAKELGCTKVLVVFDQTMRMTGTADRVAGFLKAAGIQVVEFDKVVPDPPVGIVQEGGELARNEKIDGIVAVGGGSTIDTAKGINVLINNPGSLDQYYGFTVQLAPGVPLIAMPTTSGTGSEASSGAVICDKDGVKQVIVASPTLAILDPELTLTAPPSVTASTGMDAFAHAVESLTSVFDSPFAKVLNTESAKLIWKYLPIAIADGKNLEAREKLALASNFAGLGMCNSAIHIGHCCAHTIASVTHKAHGDLCAVTLPEAIKKVAATVPEKVKYVGEILGLPVTDDMSPEKLGEVVCKALYDFNHKVGIKSLKDLGIKRETIAGRADLGAILKQDMCYYGSPVDDTPEGYAKMFTDVYDNYQ